MATNFPGALDNAASLPYPNATNGRNAPSLAQGQDNQNDALIAIEAKLGTGSSTATSGNLLIGTGAGSSAWTKAAPVGTIVGTTDIQTLANKTLASPTINSPVISNATITADVVNGFTSVNTGTIYGIAVASGSISGSNTINGSALIAGTVGPTALAQNAVQANQLSTGAITLGYAQITSNFSTAATTPVQITGLTLSVTIPSGGRRIRVSVVGQLNGSTIRNVSLTIWDGAVGSGTQIAGTTFTSGGASYYSPLYLAAIVTPSVGSKTYNAALNIDGAGTGTMIAAASSPAFIAVEAI